jgi:short-subunit dehydrogenase
MNTQTKQKISTLPARSAWSKGVKAYAIEFLESAEIELTKENVKTTLLNGADNWSQYSYGGSALIYDADIAERLCSPSELKRNRGGELQPNSRETWLDCQARALRQACNLIKSNIPRK